MKNRLFVLALGILVLVVTLAGLQGITSILPILVEPEYQPQVSSPVQLADNACHVCRRNADLCSGICSIYGGTGEIGIYIPSTIISPEGGLPPQIPLFEVTGAATTSFLRRIATSYYDGKVWRRQGNAEHYIYGGKILSPPVISYNRQMVDNVRVESLIELPIGTVPLPTSLYTIQVFSPVPLLYFPEERVFHSKESFPDVYAFRAAHYDFDNSVFLDAKIDPQNIYLQLPAAITQRTRELALTITKDGKTPYQKAMAIKNYLKANYVYDFDYNHAPEGWEPNDWFLFEEKKGVCANFNSAFVVLSRSVGISTRLVGGFAIKSQMEKQVVYADQAHVWSEVKFKDIGWYTFDATGSRSDLLPTITKIISVSPVVKKGHPFNIQGTVQTEHGSPVDGQWVKIFINSQKKIDGGRLIGEGVTSKGYFNIEATIPAEVDVGNYHILAHSQDSVRYLGSWSNHIIKVVTATNLSLQMPSRMKVQEPIMLKGNLNEEFGRPLAGQQIDIYLSNKRVAELTTDKDGQFVWEHVFNDAGAYTIKASFAGTDYYLESNQKVEFRVLTPINIKTDLEVFSAPGGFTWSYLIIVLTFALIGIGSFFIYRWQKQRRMPLAPISIRATSETQATLLPQVEKPSREVSLNIEFPQIKSPFLDVWGLDDDLEIVCHLIDPQGNRLAARPLKVYIGNELIAQLITDKNGTGQLHYTFDQKGQYELLVRFKEEPGIKDVMARRTLRIVDYREEIVNLFEILVNWLIDLGIELSRTLTPREIEYRVFNAGKGIPETDIKKIVSCFEEACYSLHTINRSNYQTMYLAQKEIREHGEKSARKS